MPPFPCLSVWLLKKLNTDGFILGELVFQAGLGDVIGMSRREPQSWKGREKVLCLAGGPGLGAKRAWWVWVGPAWGRLLPAPLAWPGHQGKG